jgi:hypothetical protein
MRAPEYYLTDGRSDLAGAHTRQPEQVAGVCVRAPRVPPRLEPAMATTRCAACAVVVGEHGTPASKCKCTACGKVLCAACAEATPGPFRCEYSRFVAGDSMATNCTKSFRDLGKSCMGQHVAFADVTEGRTSWKAGTLLVRARARSVRCSMPPT